MKNKAHFVLFALLVVLFSLGTDCNKHIFDQHLKYSFKVPVDIAPLKKTYTLADTIWFETDIAGKQLLDTISNQNITVDSTGLNAYVQYVQLAATTTNPSDGLCQIISSSASNLYRQLSKGMTSASLTDTLCGNTSLKIRIGIKPNYRGNFIVQFNSNGSMQYCNNNYSSNTYSIYNYQLKPTDLNKDLYDALPDSAKRNDVYNTQNLLYGFSNKTSFFVQVQ